MFRKLFAAALCGIVIASIASHADAAGPASFARGFAALERNAVATITPQSRIGKIDLQRKRTLRAIDRYFGDFDQTRIDL